jgi:hypothetical protein
MSEGSTARRMWHLLEPFHAITYFSPESRATFKECGFRGFWMGYFAGRAAPMGSAGSGLVTATFFNFAPRMVERSIPAAWECASPAAALDARLTGVDRAVARMLDATDQDIAFGEAAKIAIEAVGFANPSGRPLFASNSSLTPPSSPVHQLWWAATCLREHRGDGHIAALLSAGIEGIEALVTFSASGVVPRAILQDNRGWTDEEWAAATERLRSRGWLDADGVASPLGLEVRRRVEEETDTMAEEPWSAIGAHATERLAHLLEPLTRLVTSSGDIPVINPMGLPRIEMP